MRLGGLTAAVALVAHAAVTTAVVGPSPVCPNGTVPFPASDCRLSNGVEDYEPVLRAAGICCQPFGPAFAESLRFLQTNMPAFDAPNEATLFDGGIAGLTPNVSLAAKAKYPWAAAVPRAVFLDAVLPYASVNEARNNWRPLLEARLAALVMNGTHGAATNISNAATRVNDGMWAALGGIAFRSEQTPLIYDPMSTIVFGYASCTGVSILYVDALRSVGIPARVAGTPAWNQVVDHGNHNWVEVWIDGAWQFIEARPAGAGETFANPCDKWFCNKAKFANGTQVFAAAFAKSQVHFPMAWDLDNTDIAGVDRTADYQRACSSC